MRGERQKKEKGTGYFSPVLKLRLILVFQRLLKSSLSPLLHDFRDISDNDIRDVSTPISGIHSILPPSYLK